MLFIGLGISMVIMDATIVNVSLPSIIRELQIGSIDAEWINAIYSLVFAALLIIAGRLGDRVGRRLVFILGAIVFGVASIVAARTGSGEALIAARALQGVGGAMMSPTSLSLVNATYTGEVAHRRLRHLRLDHRRHGGRRASARRLAHREPLVAVGVLHQRSARHHHRRRLADVRAREQGRAHRRGPRRRRRDPVGARHRPVRLRAHRRPQLRVDHRRGRRDSWPGSTGPRDRCHRSSSRSCCRSSASWGCTSSRSGAPRRGSPRSSTSRSSGSPRSASAASPRSSSASASSASCSRCRCSCRACSGSRRSRPARSSPPWRWGRSWPDRRRPSLAARRSQRFVARLGLALEIVAITGIGVTISTTVTWWMHRASGSSSTASAWATPALS